MLGVKTVVTNSHLDSVDFRIIWTHSANEIALSDFADCWYLPWLDEKHSVVSFDDDTWFAKLGELTRAMSNPIGKLF